MYIYIYISTAPYTTHFCLRDPKEESVLDKSTNITTTVFQLKLFISKFSNYSISIVSMLLIGKKACVDFLIPHAGDVML